MKCYKKIQSEVEAWLGDVVQMIANQEDKEVALRYNTVECEECYLEWFVAVLDPLIEEIGNSVHLDSFNEGHDSRSKEPVEDVISEIMVTYILLYQLIVEAEEMEARFNDFLEQMIIEICGYYSPLKCYRDRKGRARDIIERIVKVIREEVGRCNDIYGKVSSIDAKPQVRELSVGHSG